MLDHKNITDKQFRWEFLKYANRKFTIQFSKNFIKAKNKDRKFLEKELQNLEENLTGFQRNQFYLECKQKLEKIEAKKLNGIRV